MENLNNIPKDELIDLYRMMVKIRSFEEALRRFHVAGKAPGLVHLCTGQEAVPAGFISALRVEDYITIYHRGHGHLIAKGTPMAALMGEMLHRREGLNLGRAGEPHLCDSATNNIGSTGIVGGSVPLCVGSALASKLRKNDTVSVAFFGDGALNQGVMFEVFNMASIWSLPVVFVCEDNKYGEFTEGATVTAGDGYTDRGSVFNIPSHIVDGMDVLAVRNAAESAIDRARKGEGPTFLVCETYRFTGHHVSDKQDYKDDKEMQTWLARDPVSNYAKWLINNGHKSQSELAAIDEAMDAEVAEAASAADAMRDLLPEDLDRYVYAN